MRQQILWWVSVFSALCFGCSDDSKMDAENDEDGGTDVIIDPTQVDTNPNTDVPADFEQAELGGWKLGPRADLLGDSGGAGGETGNPSGDTGGAGGAAAGTGGVGGSSGGAAGGEAGVSGGSGGAGGSADSCGTQITGIIRDMLDTHPDFERDERGPMKGLVKDQLGPNLKPVYAPEGPTFTTAGKEHFDQWYRDTPDVNLPYFLTLHLVPNAGVFTFESKNFFPLDDAGFGNQDRKHNYHFTFELHTEFRYNGGETFKFSGDDDVWVFINGRLAVDIGGVHGPQSKEIDLDDEAQKLGIDNGGIYAFDMFHAERHTVKSNFRIDTTMEFTNCSVIPTVR